MTATGVNTGRSLYGCWTCRLRKKKCDENRPSCSLCNSLGLSCHGYGPKPEWMDRGVLEREQALKLKQIISQTKLRQRHRSRHASRQLNSELDSFPVDKDLTLNHHSPSSTQGNTVVHSSAEPFYNIGSLSEHFFNQQDSTVISTHNLFNGDTDMEHADRESNSALSAYSTHNFAPAGEADAHWDNSLSGEYFQQCQSNADYLATFCEPTMGTSYNNSTSITSASSLNNQGSLSSFAQVNTPYTPILLGDQASWLACSSISALYGDTEDTLFMYYLDQVFHIQFPFYRLTGARGRGWLFAILRRAKSAYHAAIALSEYHQLTVRPSNSIAATDNDLRAKGRHYDLAIREMQFSIAQSNTWNGTLGLLHRIEALTSILQLLFFELFSGSTENWQVHLGTAATLVPTLAQAQMASIVQGPADSGHRNGQQDEEFLCFEDDSAIDFLLGYFISIDVISSASIRSSPFIKVDHNLLLERGNIHLEDLMGCQNWAIVFISEISQLDTWKKEAEKTQKLSIVEFAKRGRQIEQRLRGKLAELENTSSMRGCSGNSSKILLAPTCIEITRIFALSAITYLHIVISGAHPELPEIVDSVSKTIAAFQQLSDPQLLRSLIWPFCISGCVALEEQYGSFRRLISAAKATQSTAGTCYEAFKIIEECWEMRKTSSSSCDWVSAMNKRGRYILLF